MATVRLNDVGFRKAAEQIKAGKPIGEPVAEAAGYLGIKTGIDRSWKYQVIFGGEVRRTALLEARVTASHLGHTVIVDAAGELLAMIDGEDAPTALANIQAVGLEAATVELQATEWGDLPEGLVQLFPFGPKTLNDGRFFDVTSLSLVNVVELFARKDNPIAIDYEHNTFKDKPMGTIAAGWIWEVWAVPPSIEVAGMPDTAAVQLIREQLGEVYADRVMKYGPGIYAWVKWVESAWDRIKSREYLFLSPVFRYEKGTGEVIELKSAGLTNYPAYDGMMPVAASEQTADLLKPLQSGNVEPEIDREPAAKVENIGGSNMDFKVMAGLMGIEAATEEEFTAKASALGASVAAATANEATAQARIAELEKKELVSEATALVDQAITDRVLVAAQRDAFIALATEDRERYDAIISTMEPAAAPVVVEAPKPGNVTPIAEADEKTGMISLNFSTSGKHKVSADQMAIAEEFVAKAKIAGGGNTAKGIREHSSVIYPHLTS